MKVEGIKRAKVEIEGVSPLLMHNGQLANPMNPIVKQMKEITGKHHSKKTDADEIELMRLEFLGGLYISEDTGPFVPCECIEGCIRDAARISSKGRQVTAGLQVDPDRVRLEYEGPRTAEDLYADKNFVDVRPIKLKKSTTVMRTRPRFDSWSASFEVMTIDEVLNISDVKKFIEKAGMLKGLMDYRPKFGRFVVRDFVEV